jgi:hypothetical protein
VSWDFHWYGEPPDLAGGFASWRHLERRVDAPTVRVDLMCTPDGRDVALKRYLFPDLRSRLRAFAHTRPGGRAKARREADMLADLAARGLPVAAPLGWGVLRDAWSFVQDSWLVTLRLPGEDLERRLRAGPVPAGGWFAAGETAGLLHAAGVQHRGLSARNVVLDGPDGSGRWRAAWIDTAKSRLHGRLVAGLRAAELLRFWASLPPQVDAEARRSFAAGYGDPAAAEPDALWQQVPLPRREELERELERERRRR